MTPEILGQVRTLLAAIGGSIVAKGYFDAAVMEALVGLLVLAIPAVWSWWSKRPTSTEARQTAGRVEAHPTAEPIPPKEVSP